MARTAKINQQSRLEAWDKKFLWHPFTQQLLWEKEPTLIIRSGRGVYLTDVRGRRYLDAVSSLWVNLVGHRNPAVTLAMKRQLDKIAHSTFLGLSHEPAIKLGRALIAIAPEGLRRVFYSDNGATAVEIALKMAYQYWLETEQKSRPSFLAIRGSYHGDTLGAVSVGSIGQFHSKFKPLLFETKFAMAPACFGCPFNKNKVAHRYRCGEKVAFVPKPGDARKETGCKWECLRDPEKILKSHGSKIAAVVVEPVMQGAGGMMAMPPGYVAGLSRLAKKNNVLFIADEVATGFGRTGRMFACESENVRPDFLCVAKGITGGYSPLAATLTTDKVYRAFRAPIQQGRTFFHGHSYTAHPVGAAAALATLGLLKSSKLVEKSRRMAHILRSELRKLEGYLVVASIRQAGLMVGVELIKAKRNLGATVCKKLLAHGIWMRPLGNILVLMPPLVISEKELRRLVRTVALVLTEVTGELGSRPPLHARRSARYRRF